VKFGLFLIVLVAAFWFLKHHAAGQPSKPNHSRKQTAAPDPVANMVACAVCAVHLPASDALQGKNGHYCCPEHLHQLEP